MKYIIQYKLAGDKEYSRTPVGQAFSFEVAVGLEKRIRNENIGSKVIAIGVKGEN